MDEPTVGIDPQNRRRVLDTVLRLRDEQKLTVLYTSHLMEEVQEISDRVAIIDHGEIIALGTVGELIQKVGEEDRLIFDVGDQTVPDALLDQIKTNVEGVTSATYATARGQRRGRADGAERHAERRHRDGVRQARAQGAAGHHPHRQRSRAGYSLGGGART